MMVLVVVVVVVVVGVVVLVVPYVAEWLSYPWAANVKREVP